MPNEIPNGIQSGAEAPHSTWHHAPVHRLLERGVYMVTAGTYEKRFYFNTPARLTLLQDRLHSCATELGWTLQAWAVMANHYHFIAGSPDEPSSLRRFLNKLHMTTAKAVNQLDQTSGRKIWFEYWDTHLTFERSYLARLRYVHENPVHHRIVSDAQQYRWCSAAHFAETAPHSFGRTVAAMPIDNLEVKDDFECKPPLSDTKDKNGAESPHTTTRGHTACEYSRC